MIPETTPPRPEDLYRPVPSRIGVVKNVERESAVRLYCEQSCASWCLQVRGPMRLQGGREGRDFIVASSSLDRDDLRALRDAIDAYLGECEYWDAQPSGREGGK